MALQKHLETRQDKPKHLKQRARAKGEGTVKVKAKGIKTGEAFFKDDAGEVYRLTWDGKTREPTAHLPAGTYTLTGYRLVSGEWFISTTGGRAKVEVREGKATKLTLDPAIRIKLRAQRKRGGRLFLGMNIANDRRMGVSIYRGGKRIAIPYRFRSKGGEEVSKGSMTYG